MAKNVTDPNRVPLGDDDGGGVATMEAPGAAVVDLPDNTEVVVMQGHPTRRVPVYNSKGRQTGWETVLDKTTQFAQPKTALNKVAHHAILKGSSGKVLVMAEGGTLLARFNDSAMAKKHLAACGLSLDKLIETTKKLRGRDIRPTVPASPKGD